MEDALKAQVKTLIVENLMLQVTTAEIGDDQPLFGPGSLGLDSVDALQLVVSLSRGWMRTIGARRSGCCDNWNFLSAILNSVLSPAA